jgi:hypothetical protein
VVKAFLIITVRCGCLYEGNHRTSPGQHHKTAKPNGSISIPRPSCHLSDGQGSPPTHSPEEWDTAIIQSHHQEEGTPIGGGRQHKSHAIRRGALRDLYHAKESHVNANKNAAAEMTGHSTTTQQRGLTKYEVGPSPVDRLTLGAAEQFRDILDSASRRTPYKPAKLRTLGTLLEVYQEIYMFIFR